MLLKSADAKTKDLEILESLLTHPDVTKEKQKLIEQQIRNIRAGIKGESEAAYEINFHLKDSKNWAVIHDLRIVVGDDVAQIDHLIINRTMDMYVCESKHFSEGLAINDHGEFTAFFKSKPYGVPSPISQNERHIMVLKQLFKSNDKIIPTRLGIPISPKFSNIVLVSKNARISRPKTTVRGIENVIKSDQVRHWIDKDSKESGTLQIFKVISSETLKELARVIARKHRPIVFDWHAKFGLSKVVPVADVRPVVSVVEPINVTVISKTPAEGADQKPVKPKSMDDEFDTVKPAPKEKKKLICMKCNVAIEYKVARVCWFNKKRFGGNAYCLDCQNLFPK